MHISVWLICLRVVDVMSDFAFYAISLRGAFLEQYGDSDPETCAYMEPKVAAFLYASVFFTAFGLFLMPLDIWVGGKGTVNLFSVIVMIATTLFEDVPQIVLVLIYMVVMQGTGATDAVAIISLIISFISVVASVVKVYRHSKKLRQQQELRGSNPKWYKFEQLFVTYEEKDKTVDEVKDKTVNEEKDKEIAKQNKEIAKQNKEIAKLQRKITKAAVRQEPAIDLDEGETGFGFGEEE